VTSLRGIGHSRRVDSLAAVMYISAFNYQNPSRDVGMHTTAARGALLLLSRDVIDEFKTAWNRRNMSLATVVTGLSVSCF